MRANNSQKRRPAAMLPDRRLHPENIGRQPPPASATLEPYMSNLSYHSIHSILSGTSNFIPPHVHTSDLYESESIEQMSSAMLSLASSPASFSLQDNCWLQCSETKMEANIGGNASPKLHKWRKIAYGGMQHGFDDNHTDDSFLEDMVTNANVIKQDMLKVMLDSVCVSQYLCIVTLVLLVWTYTLGSTIDENSLLLLDVSILGLGLFVLLLSAEIRSINLLLNYLLKISFLVSGLYVLSPIYHTLTRSISSDSIWALTASLIILHLFLHDYSGSTINAPRAREHPNLTSNISLNASIMASLLIASRLPSRLHVFAFVLFSLQVFLFAPLVTYCIKKYSFRLHLLFSFLLTIIALGFAYMLHKLFFVLLLNLVAVINLVCPYWLIRIQEYKFEINGPWDEAKLCFNITE